MVSCVLHDKLWLPVLFCCRCLILAPTRELAKQVAAEFESICPSLTVVSFYGGTSINAQVLTGLTWQACSGWHQDQQHQPMPAQREHACRRQPLSRVATRRAYPGHLFGRGQLHAPHLLPPCRLGGKGVRFLCLLWMHGCVW